MADKTFQIKIKALNQTKKAFSAVSKGIRSVARAILSMKTALVGVIGIAGIGLLIRQSLNATDTLSKTARKIGTTTEALGRLRHAADITGVEVRTMDMAMQRFVRRTSEAARGTGEAKGALRELNLDANVLMSMPLDEQMLHIADAFGQVKTDADRVRLAMRLFDSEGVALVNTLQGGAEALTQMFNEAESLGIIMSGSAAQGVEDANDALTRLFSLFKGIKDQIVAALAPAIENLATILKDKLLERLRAVNGSFAELANQIRDQLLGALVSVLTAIAKIVRAFEGAVDAATYLFHAVKAFTEGKEIVEDFSSVVGTFSNVFLDAANSVQQFSLGLNDFVENSGAVKESLTATRTLTDDIRDAFSRASDAIPSLQEGLLSVANSMSGSLTQGFTDAITGTKKASDAFKDMAKSVIASLTKMLVQYYITKPLFDVITGSIGGGSSVQPQATQGSVPVGNLTSDYSGSRTFAGGGYTGRGGRAGGLDGKGGFPAILHPNETVIDHARGQGMGAVVNQTINVTTGVQQTVRAEIQNMMPQIQDAAISAVAEAKLRGGTYAKTFGA